MKRNCKAYFFVAEELRSVCYNHSPKMVKRSKVFFIAMERSYRKTHPAISKPTP